MRKFDNPAQRRRDTLFLANVREIPLYLTCKREQSRNIMMNIPWFDKNCATRIKFFNARIKKVGSLY